MICRVLESFTIAARQAKLRIPIPPPARRSAKASRSAARSTARSSHEPSYTFRDIERVRWALVVPSLTPATANIPIVAPGTEFTSRYNQIDFGASRTFRFGHTSIMPRLDLFNAFNSDAFTSVSTLQYGVATYMQPSVILQGRLIRVGADVKW